MKEPLAVVILTLNEELNLPKALRSIGRRAPVIVVDSGSRDRTRAIAEAAGAEFVVHPFVDYAKQRNFALDLVRERFEWVLFVDADEEVPDDLWAEIEAAVARDDLDGAYLRLELWMMGYKITHGELSTAMGLRLMRPGVATFRRASNERVDDKDMRVAVLRTRLVHRDIKPISEWFHKHIRYAEQEAKVYLDGMGQRGGLQGFTLRTKAGRMIGVRWVYNHLPLFVRPFLFHARAVVQGALLDGLPGFIHSGMHALWYPMVIDLMIYEELQRREAGRLSFEADSPAAGDAPA
ncbi:MAG: glycosyltransferase family 2 protein [Nannocystaceae bacterium]